jgi:hypothetical protein
LDFKSAPFRDLLEFVAGKRMVSYHALPDLRGIGICGMPLDRLAVEAQSDRDHSHQYDKK